MQSWLWSTVEAGLEVRARGRSSSSVGAATSTPSTCSSSSERSVGSDDDGDNDDRTLARDANAAATGGSWPSSGFKLPAGLLRRRGRVQTAPSPPAPLPSPSPYRFKLPRAQTAPSPPSPSPSPAPYRVGLRKEEAPAHVTYPYVLGPVYRSGGDRARCARALFELHAETWNAWTIVLGAVMSTALLAYALSVVSAADGVASHQYRSLASDKLPFALMTSAVLLHAPWSVCFHVFRVISPEEYNLWRRLDQVFIFQVSQLLTLAIGWFVYDSGSGSSVSWGLALNVAAAVMTAAVATRDIWGLPHDFQRNRVHMVAFVGAVVVCYWAPMGWQLAKDLSLAARLAGPPSWAAAAYSSATFASLAVGAAVFAAGFPERWCPGGRFDCFFSHVWMHVFAAAAHVLEYLFVVEMFRRRRAEAAASVAAPVAAHAAAAFA